MAYSKISYIGDGSTTSYTTPSYIEKSHITVMLDGVQSFEHSWTGPNTITFNTAPSAGAVIEIVRNSSQQTRLVNYQQPSPLDAETLNRDSKQAFYMAQEALDESALALHRTPDGDSYDAEGNPIINVGSPANGSDAATKSYVDIAVATGVPGGPITLFTVADYTELRGLTTAAYAANRVFVSSPAPGEFWHDSTDTTSADDGGVIIVDADGRRWKRLESYAGYVCPTWWGAKPGGAAADNHAAIQACFNAYIGANKRVHKILFTRKGGYEVSSTLVIHLDGNIPTPFNIDLGDSTVSSPAANSPVIEVRGSRNYLWKIANGRIAHTAVSTASDTNAICLAFAGGPDDGTTDNGPNNGVIERIQFKGGCTSIGVRDKDQSDSAYTIWDIRVQNCTFDSFVRHAIDIKAVPAYSTSPKNFTIRSCYINDGYLSGASTIPILNFQSTVLVNIDDLEVIQTRRPVLFADSCTVTIRAVSVENPGTSSPPFPSNCPYLMRFHKSPTTIESLNLMTLRSDVGAGNRMALIYATSDEFNDIPVIANMMELLRLSSVSGGFALFGGNQYGRIYHNMPATYTMTTPVDCSLFEYDPAKANNAVLPRTRLTYFANRPVANTATSGTITWTVDSETNCLVFTQVPTGNITVNVQPNETPASMSQYKKAGYGAYLRVVRQATAAFTLTVNWGGGSITIPANKRGVIEVSWHQSSGWLVTNYSVYD